MRGLAALGRWFAFGVLVAGCAVSEHDVSLGERPDGASGGTGGATGGTGGVVTGGTGGAIGSAGSAGTGTGCDFIGPSCGGAGVDCGGESCCTSLNVNAGTFYRGTDSLYPATVSNFCLDKYEITVGRFREFLAAYDGWRAASHPTAGEGAHLTPAIAGSGWDPAWNSSLPASAADFQDGSHLTYCGSNTTWRAIPRTGSPAGEEDWAVNCIDWYEAFAFCIWDEGYLPTEVEWEYAAAGGDAQGTYPWGNTPSSDPLPANYNYTDNSPFVAVGSHQDGNGRWGQADSAGSMREWAFDWFASPFSPANCDDCANTTAATTRVIRGGSWNDYATPGLTAAHRNDSLPTDRNTLNAARCARPLR